MASERVGPPPPVKEVVSCLRLVVLVVRGGLAVKRRSQGADHTPCGEGANCQLNGSADYFSVSRQQVQGNDLVSFTSNGRHLELGY